MRRLATPRAAVVALVLSALLVAGAVAYAAIPDSSGAIQACYGRNGQVRVVDEPADCRRAETSIALGGPTSGFEFSDPDQVDVGHLTTVVGFLDLPAGKYLVHGKLNLRGSSLTDESFVVCNLAIGGTSGFSAAAWETVTPGADGRFPSESVALQTSLVLSSDGRIVMTCVRPDGAASPGAIARYRKLDAVSVDGFPTSGPGTLPERTDGAGSCARARDPAPTMPSWRPPSRTLRETGIR